MREKSKENERKIICREIEKAGRKRVSLRNDNKKEREREK